MKNYSLKFRLLIGGTVAIFAALTFAWLIMILLFERHIERRIEDELKRYAFQLIADLTVDPAGTAVIVSKPIDPRFLKPASGLYWQISTKAEVLRSRSLWDQVMPKPHDATLSEWRTHLAPGPFGQTVFVLERLIEPGDEAGDVLIQIAHNEETVKEASAEFGRELGMFLLVLWVFLSAAAWVQVYLGLKPLSYLRKELVILRQNPTQRMGAKFPREVTPLTTALNELLSAREADLTRAKQRAADLAHGLKTPLAALSAQSRIIKESGGATEGMERAILAAKTAIDAELARTRAAASQTETEKCKAFPLVVSQRLISVLERTEKGMRLDYQINIPEALYVNMNPDDLNEILGPLLENAVKFARRVVRITGVASERTIALRIEDDGPGIEANRMAEALKRGKRLDEAGGGHGLGLAIARTLVEATYGDISLGKADIGGLNVELHWPVR
ncbi:sensor histidine kinase [Kordiimonas pumila]|uniref:histidine kinase n=1 Tax=Kordiimonas pumila TaxID=2161677 RepID=A0ABV7D6I3_9PROT|nr:HAMP domain-containing sensor histidine kinase [Kordiimonas pumila]